MFSKTSNIFHKIKILNANKYKLFVCIYSKLACFSYQVTQKFDSLYMQVIHTHTQLYLCIYVPHRMKGI